MYDRKEYQEMTERLEKDAKVNNGLSLATALSHLQQASVHHSCLTNDDHWNYFLTQIQSWLELTKKSKQTFLELLSNPEVVEPNMVNNIRNHLFICEERINTLEAVIGFPRQIMEAGERAKLVLSEIGEKNIVDKGTLN